MFSLTEPDGTGVGDVYLACRVVQTYVGETNVDSHKHADTGKGNPATLPRTIRYGKRLAHAPSSHTSLHI